GGTISADVTDGYGPEVFVVEGEPQAFPYRVEVESYRQGATGHAFGSVDIVRHDGRGGLTFETRPFVIMTEGATIDLGAIERTKPDCRAPLQPGAPSASATGPSSRAGQPSRLPSRAPSLPSSTSARRARSATSARIARVPNTG